MVGRRVGLMGFDEIYLGMGERWSEVKGLVH